ncbi:excalibur calcium-binding protein [Kitasatospora terrestris]|uniref:Excalibur calcium-binding domain-containing protein n=1 Tax=Kitasatospora terrestris TaxID=258051 RepID=A0ABP9D7C5_9ACTN
MRMRLTVATTLLIAAAWSLPLAGSAQAADLDCPNFSTQQEAQAVLNADPSDPNNLDADNDNIACEDLPSGTGSSAAPAAPGAAASAAPSAAPSASASSGAAAVVAPTGPVAAGVGRDSGGGQSAVAISLAGGSVLAAGGAFVARRRVRRSGR